MNTPITSNSLEASGTSESTPRTTLGTVLKRYRWLLALRGVVAIIFGILTFVQPTLTLFTLIVLFGAYSLANGILALLMATQASRGSHRFTGFILPGVFSMAAGIITFFLPGLTTLTLTVVIAFWLIVIGFVEFLLAVRLRKVTADGWMLILASVLSFVFGASILLWPAVGILAILGWLGVISMFYGVFLLNLVRRISHLRLHSHANAVDS